VLHALAGCLTTTRVYHAAARGIEIKGVTTRIEGDADLRGFLGLDPNIRRGFKTVRAAFDINESRKQELIAMTRQYSAVFDIVTNGVPVTCTLGKAERTKAA
jgi:uncharacterized OsmC-like protein